MYTAVVHHSSTSTICTYVPNFIEIEETFCGRTDVGLLTHGLTHGLGVWLY